MKKITILLGIAILAGADSPPKPGDVTEARVLTDSANWLVGGRDFNEQHFSPLKQVTDKNIGKLGLAWATDIESPMGLATEPIVVDGVIYVSLPQSRVYAVDASSGKVLWRFDPKVRLDRMRNSWSARSQSRIGGLGRQGLRRNRRLPAGCRSMLRPEKRLGNRRVRWKPNRHYRRAACG